MPRRERLSPTQAQIELVPQQQPTGTLQSIRLDRIHTLDTAQTSVAPTPQFVASIQRFGVLMPIAVRRNRPDSQYDFTIVDGRRRYLASVWCGYETIPALVFDADTPNTVVASMTITTNLHRRQNFVSELNAIQILLHEGASVAQIAERLCIPERLIHNRMRLMGMHHTLYDALISGRMSINVAQRIVGLPMRAQEWLARRERGEYTQQDVRDAEREFPNTNTQMSLSGMESPVTIIDDAFIEWNGRRYVTEAYLDATLAAATALSGPVSITDLVSQEDWPSVRVLAQALEDAIPADASNASDEAIMLVARLKQLSTTR